MTDFNEKFPPEHVWLHVTGTFGLFKKTNHFDGIAKCYRSPTYEHGEFMTWEFEDGAKVGSHYFFCEEWEAA